MTVFAGDAPLGRERETEIGARQNGKDNFPTLPAGKDVDSAPAWRISPGRLFMNFQGAIKKSSLAPMRIEDWCKNVPSRILLPPAVRACCSVPPLDTTGLSKSNSNAP